MSISGIGMKAVAAFYLVFLSLRPRRPAYGAMPLLIALLTVTLSRLVLALFFREFCWLDGLDTAGFAALFDVVFDLAAAERKPGESYLREASMSSKLFALSITKRLVDLT